MTVKRIAGLLAALVLVSCGLGSDKLDEAFIYDGPQFRLKLVRYYVNMLLHYTGEVYRVQCASDRTTRSPKLDTQEAGWVTAGNGGAIGSKSAAELVEQVRSNYIVVDEGTLVWLNIGVNVSFDACGRFRGWYPSSLPADVIDPVEKPDYCRPKGTADCRNYDFMGDRAPRYEDFRVSPDGRIAFTARSKAFRDGKSVRVWSADFGKTWSTDVF